MLFEEVFRKLNKYRVKYLVIGGIAANLQGFSRLTMDLDIMLEPERDNFERLFDAMDELGYEQSTPVKLKDMHFEEGHVKITDWKGIIMVFRNPKDELDRVDVFLKNPMGFDRAYKNHEIREINGTRVHVACIDDLIELKELSGREKDWRDIGYLKLAKKIAQETDEKE